MLIGGRLHVPALILCVCKPTNNITSILTLLRRKIQGFLITKKNILILNGFQGPEIKGYRTNPFKVFKATYEPCNLSHLYVMLTTSPAPLRVHGIKSGNENTRNVNMKGAVNHPPTDTNCVWY